MNYKKIFTLLPIICVMIFSTARASDVDEAQAFKAAYDLQRHSESGWFAEIYTAPFQQKHRATAGSIYFLLDGDDVSHFHQLDCDEIWYYHAGCGMKIFMLSDGQVREVLLGVDTARNEQPMVVIPKGVIFAAENLDKDSFTFISCVTTPRFDYKGFRLITRAELKKKYPRLPDEILRLAYENA